MLTVEHDYNLSEPVMVLTINHICLLTMPFTGVDYT